MKKINVFLFALMLMAGLAHADTSIRVDGSTTVLPAMQKIVEAYMKANAGVNITVSGGGSGNGIKAIIDGTTNVAMSSREITEKELATAKEKGHPVKPMEIAMDAIVPIVNPANPVTNLTAEQLQGIYAGKIKNWKEVGGEDKEIVIISRDSSSGTYEAWNELIMKGQRVTPAALLQASSGAVLQVVSKNKAAIAYDGIAYVNNSVKGLQVNGVTGGEKSVADKTYPVARPLFIIVPEKLDAPVQKFVDYIMDAANGQKIIKEVGYFPVKK
ncbi:PstS family phosphate ABC transporter substrate-binding protein [Fundidesulfovibrio terrae]|uniref:PstS family phosphate ABC transporter substrate-binding protein n=1 Tax=Fundidesulfovibrio terrae TaxID=2922866 RepID=UPI001FAFE0DE|nr:PstS family phosphate ABC transporter substrate-binding protein [Fundidesulfovibrio terrae]